MFTETELREALEHSAARADDLDVAPAKPSRRWLLPVAAAATVAALAVGVVALAGGSADRGPAPIGGTPPLARVDLVDRAAAGVDADYVFKDVSVRATGGQTISHDLGPKPTDGTAELTVLPATFVDEDQIERGEKVSIAGTAGWFAQRTLYELDGQEGAAPGQDDPLPEWTIAFRTPDGDWAFARISSATVDSRDGTYTGTTVKDPARIVAAYDDLDIRWVRDGARQPLRFGTLPDDARLMSAGYTRKQGRVTDESLTFAHGTESFTIDWSTRSDAGTSTAGCQDTGGQTRSPVVCSVAMRSVAGGMLRITGAGEVEPNDDADKAPYAKAQQQVLADVTVATDPDDYVSFEQAVTP